MTEGRVFRCLVNGDIDAAKALIAREGDLVEFYYKEMAWAEDTKRILGAL